MSTPRTAWGVACVLLAAAAGVHAQSLRHDPFARPWRTPPQTAPAAPGPAGEERVPGWNPQLRGVMLAGPASMVNVNGEMLRIGDRIDGYRLAEVRAETAVFMKEGRRVVVSMQGGTTVGAGGNTEKP